MRKVCLICFLFVSSICFAKTSEWGNGYPYDEVGEHQEGTYKILTLDGGGIRGVFTLQLLAMLDEELDFIKNVDFFAGTSTGSMIAYALAYGFTPRELLDLYIEYGHLIFTPYSSVAIDPLSFYPTYNNSELKKFLATVIKDDLTLADLPKKVLSVSFQLYNETTGTWSPCLLDNMDRVCAKNILVLDAILRSEAAPIYFPSYQGCIDGGVIANNPSMAALARALDKNGANQSLENIRLFSIGTGLNTNYIDEDVAWGATQWMIYCPLTNPNTPSHPLLEILFDGTVAMPHYQCKQILGHNYYRLNASFSKTVLLDDWKRVDFLIEEAKNLPQSDPEKWAQLKMWIKTHFCN